MSNVALIVAGPGKTTPQEVSDLLDDKFADADLVDVYYPMGTKEFTPAVEAVLLWADNPNNGGSNVGITVTGTSVGRKSKKYFHIEGPDEAAGPDDWTFDSFAETFTLDFGDSEVFFLVAVPQEDEEPDADVLDALVQLVTTAKDTDLPVLDLCAALDDVNLSAPEPEPEPEPEPTPEPAKTRGRRKATAPKADEPVDGLQEEVNSAAQRGTYQSGSDAEIFQQIGDLFHALAHRAEAVGASTQTPVNLNKDAGDPEAQPEASEPAAEATEAPRRGRGRPRTTANLQKQIFDADDDKWIPRPKGRVARGTKTRTVDLDLDPSATMYEVETGVV